MGMVTLATNPTLGTTELIAVASMPSAPPPNPRSFTICWTAPRGRRSCGFCTGHAATGQRCSGPNRAPRLTFTVKKLSPGERRT